MSTDLYGHKARQSCFRTSFQSRKSPILLSPPVGGARSQDSFGAIPSLEIAPATSTIPAHHQASEPKRSQGTIAFFLTYMGIMAGVYHANTPSRCMGICSACLPMTLSSDISCKLNRDMGAQGNVAISNPRSGWPYNVVLTLTTT